MNEYTQCSNCGEEVNSETGVWNKGQLLCFHCLCETKQKELKEEIGKTEELEKEINKIKERILWIKFAGDAVCLLIVVVTIIFIFGKLVSETDESFTAARGVLLLIPSFLAGLFYCNIKHSIKLLKEESRKEYLKSLRLLDITGEYKEK